MENTKACSIMLVVSRVTELECSRMTSYLQGDRAENDHVFLSNARLLVGWILTFKGQ